MTDKGAHLTLSERQIIETGISKGASKKSIADTIGKDKSTIGKEIKNHRVLKRYYQNFRSDYESKREGVRLKSGIYQRRLWS